MLVSVSFVEKRTKFCCCSQTCIKLQSRQRKAVAGPILIVIFDEGEATTAKRFILKISSQS